MDSTTRRYGYALIKILRLCIISILLVKSLSGVMTAQMKIQLGAKNARDDSSSGHSKRQKREEEVDTVFDQLKEKHGSKYNTPHLRLWARMIANSLHDDFEEPPAFSSVSKRP